VREPMPNERYQDKQGNAVTVRMVAFNRVTFVRDGYSEPCLMLLPRFLTAFTLIQEASNGQ